MNEQENTEPEMHDEPEQVDEPADPIQQIMARLDAMEKSTKRFRASVNSELKMRREEITSLRGGEKPAAPRVDQRDDLTRSLQQELMTQVLKQRGLDEERVDKAAELLVGLQPDQAKAFLDLLQPASSTPPKPRSDVVRQSRGGPQTKPAAPPIRSQADLLKLSPAERAAFMNEASDDDIKRLLGG